MSATGNASVGQMAVSRSINVAVLMVLAAVVLAGCASAAPPPPVPITDMRQIEGKWQGTITLGMVGAPEMYYLEIRPDGSMVAQWRSNWQFGKVTLSGGAASFDMSPASSGALTYSEGPGGRSLTLTPTFDKWSANVTPVK